MSKILFRPVTDASDRHTSGESAFLVTSSWLDEATLRAAHEEYRLPDQFAGDKIDDLIILSFGRNRLLAFVGRLPFDLDEDVQQELEKLNGGSEYEGLVYVQIKPIEGYRLLKKVSAHEMLVFTRIFSGNVDPQTRLRHARKA